MKIKGIDHVLMVVKDMDRAVQFLSGFFETRFEEVPWTSDRIGMRICIDSSRSIELVSVVDAEKTKGLPPIYSKLVTFALEGGEGPYMICMGVDDADEAKADAEKKGVRVAQVLEEKQLLPMMPHFKEVIFNEEDMPVKGFYIVGYPRKE